MKLGRFLRAPQQPVLRTDITISSLKETGNLDNKISNNKLIELLQ